jgi:SulP family sulfate permease
MVPTGWIIGVAGGLLTLLLIENKRFPAGLVVVLSGLLLGLIFGLREGFDEVVLGFHLPEILPFGWPSTPDLTFAVFALVLPQIPMSLGNAVIAYADLSRDYFGEDARRVSYRGACISMALANFLSFFVGGMPLCHGAGGLAAHYRFGARTAGSNLMIGLIFVLLALLLGKGAITIIHLIPLSILGILLLFAGAQLAMTVSDMEDRKGLFVCLTVLGITLATNLAAGFIAGIVIAHLLKIKSLEV